MMLKFHPVLEATICIQLTDPGIRFSHICSIWTIHIHASNTLMLAAIEQSHIPRYSNMTNNLLTYTFMYIVLYACTVSVKQLVLSVRLLVISTKITRSRDLGIWVTCKCKESIKVAEKLASLCFKLSMNIANTIFYWPCLSTLPPCAFCSCTNRAYCR